MIDYKKIADNDVGGELDAALSTMKLLTEDSAPEELRVTYLTIASKIGPEERLELETALEAQTMFKGWVHASLLTYGINVNDEKVSGILTSLNLTDGLADLILALGVETRLMLPSLRAGHLEVARAKRMAGEI